MLTPHFLRALFLTPPNTLVGEREREREREKMNFVKAQLEKAERFVETVEQKVAERVVIKVDEDDDFVGRPKVVLSDDSENDFDEADDTIPGDAFENVAVDSGGGGRRGGQGGDEERERRNEREEKDDDDDALVDVETTAEDGRRKRRRRQKRGEDKNE